MSMFMIILIAILGLVVMAAMYFVSSYNSLVRLKALVQEAWSGIDVQLKRRYDLIPNLIETVKGYAGHERGIFEKVAEMRAASMGAGSIEEKAEAEAGLTKALKTLFAVVENYPDLKANENFLSLQQDLNKIEDELQLARRYYNGATRNYNIAVHTFPINIVAGISGFGIQDYFEVDDAQERQAPKVKF